METPNQSTELTLRNSLAELSGGEAVVALELSMQKLERAKKAYTEKYKDMPYSPKTSEAMDKFEALAKDYLVKLNTARKPLTQKLTEITKFFTQPENEWKGLAENINAKRMTWKRAVQAEKDAAEALQRKENEKKRVIAEFRPDLDLYLEEMLLTTKLDFLQAVVDKNEEAIANPFIFTEDGYIAACHRVLTRINGTEHKGAAAASVKDDKAKIISGFNEKFTDFKKEVFKNKDKPAALKNLGKQIGFEFTEAKAELEQTKDEAILNHEIAAVETATVVSSGPEIKTKLVCKPANAKEFLQLAAVWITKNEIGMAELELTFSKALTMANRMGLKGETINGVTFVKDVK